jgi:membrane protease YdiL (CAAX protease family)
VAIAVATLVFTLAHINFNLNPFTITHLNVAQLITCVIFGCITACS